MKRRKRTTRLVVETERTYVLRSRGSARPVWCAACGAEAEAAPVAEAAARARLGEMAVYRLAESGALHVSEDEGGRVLVCLNSLARFTGHETGGTDGRTVGGG